jgi:hypothetical protein
LGLGGRRKHTLQDNSILQARIWTVEGSRSTLGVDNTFGEVRPSLGRRRGPMISTLKDDVITTPGPRAVHLGRAWWAGTKHAKKARPRHGTARNYFGPGRAGTMHRAGFGPKPRPMGGHEPGPFNKARKGPLPGTKRPVIINPASQPILPFATARCQPNAHERTKTRPTVQVQLPQTQTPSRPVQSPQKP